MALLVIIVIGTMVQDLSRGLGFGINHFFNRLVLAVKLSTAGMLTQGIGRSSDKSQSNDVSGAQSESTRGSPEGRIGRTIALGRASR